MTALDRESLVLTVGITRPLSAANILSLNQAGLTAERCGVDRGVAGVERYRHKQYEPRGKEYSA